MSQRKYSLPIARSGARVGWERLLLAAGTAIVMLGVCALRGSPAAAQALFSGADYNCFGIYHCSTAPPPVIELPPQLANSPAGANPNDSITQTEQEALQQAAQGGLSANGARQLLGKLEIYDRNLSPNRFEACASCHTKEAGFTGGVSAINLANSAYPGAVFYRGAQRKPNSYGYAPFAPVLHYDPGTGQFVGGNFWDLRATGMITGNPSGDQALAPPVDPLEMAMPDQACIVYRISTGPYRALFEQVWGAQSFAIDWPNTAEQQCSQPQSVEASNPTLPTFDSNNPPTVLNLSPGDRAAAIQAFHNFGLAAAAYEGGPEVSAFTSEFDYYLQGKANLTQAEQLGYSLFTGRAHCSECHSASGAQPLFTNWTTANIGLPRNPQLPFYGLTQPDQYGFVPNPSGQSYVDPGLGGYLASPSDTNPDWKVLAPSFTGRFQVATLRNVARQPGGPQFFKAYTHNGFFKTIKDVVHFYNTRDVLPACPVDATQFGVYPPVGATCWPAPEVPQNVNHTQTGNLGLSDSGEAAIVSFLGTLTDDYTPGQSGN